MSNAKTRSPRSVRHSSLTGADADRLSIRLEHVRRVAEWRGESVMRSLHDSDLLVGTLVRPDQILFDQIEGSDFECDE